ncbi:uncharacterized protein LOC136067644 [Quercus suber]|uniref:uncharacterized protein LOC136067644 n=1 Tax=Quercus suber TaxID=58331 RepID=UPI0032DE4DF0
MFNEIDENFDNVAIRTFKVGLPAEHDLRKSLTRKPAKRVCQLMDRIDEYKRVEKDRQQGKGKAKIVSQGRRDFRAERYSNNRLRRNFAGHTGPTIAQVVSTVFKEPMHQILEKPNGQGSQLGSAHQRDASLRPPLGKISVILAIPSRTGSYLFKVMPIARPYAEDLIPDPKRGRMEVPLALSFFDKDKVGTLQPHDDALVVTLKIEGYDVKRVLVDQGGSAKIMYPDLYRGLKLKPMDLAYYDSPLLGFDGKTVTPKGQIILPVQVGSKVAEVDFIVVYAYSPYTVIVARP